jgi:HlyD family secretion protein
LQAAVDDARANVDRVQAQYAAALDQYRRNKPLYDKKYISAIEFNQYQSALEAAKASVTSAQVALQRARTNFGYAEIRSPTDGTVIQRAVEPGQTVAASLSTPTLFTIAQDLSQMQIEAQVDESDIGQIKEGQSAEFSVQSQGSRTFQGTVKQIRLQPQTVQNVVNYTVVVDARNPDKLLLPGMTATINFSVNRVADVLTVPNAALRFQPSQEVLDAMREKSGQSDSAAFRMRQTANRQGDSTTRTQRTAAGGTQRSRGRLWTLDEKGELKMILVRVGLSDGQRTEVSGPDVHEGMKVVTSSAQPQQTTSRPGTGLPFGGGGGGGGRRGGF